MHARAHCNRPALHRRWALGCARSKEQVGPWRSAQSVAHSHTPGGALRLSHLRALAHLLRPFRCTQRSFCWTINSTGALITEQRTPSSSTACPLVRPGRDPIVTRCQSKLLVVAVEPFWIWFKSRGQGFGVVRANEFFSVTTDDQWCCKLSLAYELVVSRIAYACLKAPPVHIAESTHAYLCLGSERKTVLLPILGLEIHLEVAMWWPTCGACGHCMSTCMACHPVCTTHCMPRHIHATICV
jgi:hypothetical protein